MKLEYDLTEDDLVDYLFYDHRNAPRLFPKARRTGVKPALAVWAVGFLLFLLVVAIGPALFQARLTWADSACVYIPLGIVLVVVGPGLLAASRFDGGRKGIRRRVRRALAEGQIDFLGPTETQATPDELRVHRSTCEWWKPWSQFALVAQGEEGFYIYLNPMDAEIIPRRAFGDDTQAREFLETVTGYIEAANSAGKAE